MGRADSSVFHTPEWLEVLRSSYGYQPLVFTTAEPGQALTNGVAFCIVKSWLVRPRLVSLPFSDHAAPLLNNDAELSALVEFLQKGQAEGKWDSIEFRPPSGQVDLQSWGKFHDGQTFVLHLLDLRPPLEQLFRGLHKDSMQRKVHRAQREGLIYREGSSEEDLQEFYRLTIMTRRRHFLPPPPLLWFRNILKFLGENAKICLAYKDGAAIASILTIRHRDTLVYKYGASDSQYHALGGMPFLLWKSIEGAKSTGATGFDLGRSDPQNQGLLVFKDRLGANRSFLTLKKFPVTSTVTDGGTWHLGIAKRLFAVMPKSVLVQAGRLIYPHIG